MLWPPKPFGNWATHCEAGGGGKVKRLRAALQEPTLSPCARELIEEELNFVLVLDCVNLTGDRAKRQKICELVKRSNGELKIGLVARASPCLAMRDGVLVSSVGTQDRVSMRLFNTFGFTLMLIGAAVFLASPMAFPQVEQSVRLLALTILGVVFMVAGIWLLSQPDATRIAEHIAPQMEALQRQSGDAPPVGAPPGSSACQLKL